MLRLAEAFFVIFAVSILTFAAFSLSPGSVLNTGSRDGGIIDPEQVKQERADSQKSFLINYSKWAWRFLQFDLGKSKTVYDNVSNVLFEKLKRTLSLTGIGTFLTILIAVPLAIYCGRHRGGTVDKACTATSILLLCTPVFFLAITFKYFLPKIFPLPTSGREEWASYIMPVLAFILSNISVWFQYQRSAFLDAYHQDFIKTARSKGLEERYVVWHHAVPNSMLPMITLSSYLLVSLVEGSIVLEKLFSWGGIAEASVSALTKGDHYLMAAIVMLSSICLIIGLTISDILYIIVDPRTRKENQA